MSNDLKNALTADQFTAAMRDIYETPYDPDEAHSLADELFCNQLRAMGYGQGVEVFERATRWYS